MRIICKMVLLLAGMLLIQGFSANARQEQKEEPWRGALRDGTLITQQDLSKILAEHNKFIETDGEEGKRAILARANLSAANLSGAILRRANLSGADLSGANLPAADLREADLSRAHMVEANLSGAYLSGADLTFVLFEPKLGSLPDIPFVATARNLFLLTFKNLPHGLVELREAFKKAGFRKQEREITYALMHTQRRKLWEDEHSSIRDKIESVFNLIMFEATCKYGMSPGRALLILFVLLLLFSILYMMVLILPSLRKGRTGIWALRLPDRLHKGLSKEKPVKLTNKVIFRPMPSGKLRKIKEICFRYLRVIRIGFYFSLLSAFRIGWRELNVGNWMERLQRREYTLRSHGWIRFASGFQALVSVYLIALWVLTYFGRPFE